MASTSQEPAPSGRGPVLRWLRPWVPFVALGVAAICIAWFDSRLKATDMVGFVPEGAQWQVTSTDVPDAWRRWTDHPAYARFRTDGPAFMSELALSIRKQTGVRPTPERLRFWLGDHGVIAGHEKGWSLSVRPGVALRVVSFIHGLVSRAPRPGIHVWGPLAYGWRDGYLVVSRTPEHVETVITGGSLLAKGPLASDTVEMSWDAGRFRLALTDGLPFTMTIAGVEDLGSGTLHFSDPWPEAMAVLNTHHTGSPAEFLDRIETWARPLVGDTMATVWDTVARPWWAAYLPPIPTLDCGGERVYMVFPPTAPRESALPRIAHLQTECDRGLYGASVADLDVARPFQWDAHTGWLVATPRHTADWSIATDKGRVGLTSDSTLMPALLERGARPGTSAVFSLQWRWKPVCAATEALLATLAEGELVPGLNLEDMESQWFPYLDGLRSWDGLTATGLMSDDGLSIEGQLAALKDS